MIDRSNNRIMCLDNSDWGDRLTIGKYYHNEYSLDGGTYVRILDDKGSVGDFLAERFDTVSIQRSITINKILK